MFFVCLALDNLKSTTPALLCGALGFPPLASGNRRFGVLNCRKPQKYDSRPFCKAAIVPVVFLGRKPQNYDSRPLLYAGLGHWVSRHSRAGIVCLVGLAAESLKYDSRLGQLGTA